ncbi:hypothetical protein CC78DRAFT_619437 [Lojkania enalia]|uniref:NAD-dependent epimerase/dehydratase domain-containing protein n=1 Tax=Lojkania enalia TaxID=147567 RepID=A0A9P4K3C7_9PLEO|nr:hypothetical protein CC78DRAFT_619437 [Didymosphaeria enalia]
MKVLITGATGIIGSASLRHCLNHPSITSVIALSRRPLPSSISNNPKLKTIISSDFKNYDEQTLSQISDADAMVFALGTSDGNEDANINYPLAFQEAFLRILKNMKDGNGKRFRYIHISGAFVEQDQSRSLLFYANPRRVKGRADTRTLELAQRNKDVWQAFLLRPGAVLTGKFYDRVVERVVGRRYTIRAEELGAFIADMVVHGSKEDGIVWNERIAAKGRELLENNGS